MNKTFNELANESIYIETTCLNPLSDKQGICSFKNENGYLHTKYTQDAVLCVLGLPRISL